MASSSVQQASDPARLEPAPAPPAGDPGTAVATPKLILPLRMEGHPDRLLLEPGYVPVASTRVVCGRPW
jgi:hypothetical protein